MQSACRAPSRPRLHCPPMSSGTNQNTPPTGHRRVCLFLELRKRRAPRQLSSGGSNPGGSIGGGRRAGPTPPVPVMGPGQAQGRAASRRQPGQEGRLPGRVLPSPPERLSGPCCPQSGAGRARFRLPQRHGAMTPAPLQATAPVRHRPPRSVHPSLSLSLQDPV